MRRNWRRLPIPQWNCCLERRLRWLNQLLFTDRQLLINRRPMTDRRLLTHRQMLIDGRRGRPLPSSGRQEFKNPSANSRSPMPSPANPSRSRIRRSASWKSSRHFAGHSVCQLAATASRLSRSFEDVFVHLVSAAEQRAHHAAEQGARAATATAVVVTAATAAAATAGRTRYRLVVVR